MVAWCISGDISRHNRYPETQPSGKACGPGGRDPTGLSCRLGCSVIVCVLLLIRMRFCCGICVLPFTVSRYFVNTIRENDVGVHWLTPYTYARTGPVLCVAFIYVRMREMRENNRLGVDIDGWRGRSLTLACNASSRCKAGPSRARTRAIDAIVHTCTPRPGLPTAQHVARERLALRGGVHTRPAVPNVRLGSDSMAMNTPAALPCRHQMSGWRHGGGAAAACPSAPTKYSLTAAGSKRCTRGRRCMTVHNCSPAAALA